MMLPLLDIKNMSVMFSSRLNSRPVSIIKNISFSLNHGETLGIIGESGSGKSITLLSLMGLLNSEPGIVSGSIVLNAASHSVNLLKNIENHFFYDGDTIKIQKISKWKKEREKRYKNLRGKEISMIFQNPKQAFNPYYSIGSQINEMIRLHTQAKEKSEAKIVAIDWLRRVKMEAPELRYNNNPYGLSGGMIQRAMIAMALSSNPSILIADEPTTGLDATIQTEILDLLISIKKNSNLSMIVVSHDFNVMRQLSDRLIVYYRGRIVEQGLTSNLLNVSRKNTHPYTRQLLDANLLQENTNTQIDQSENSSQLSFHQSSHIGCDYFESCQIIKKSIKNQCKTESPPLFHINQDHHIRCWHFAEHNDG